MCTTNFSLFFVSTIISKNDAAIMLTEPSNLKPPSSTPDWPRRAHGGVGDLKGSLGDCTSHLSLCFHTQNALTHRCYTLCPSFTQTRTHTHANKQATAWTLEIRSWRRRGGGGDGLDGVCVGAYLCVLGWGGGALYRTS